MAGELFRQVWQAAVEPQYGTDTAATRKMYFRDDSRLTREREPRIHKFATGSRDNVRNISLGPERASGQVSLPVSAEIIELLLLGIRGAVTPTGAGATKTWTFTPGNSLDSAVIEWNDGAIARQMLGAQVESLKFAGSVDGENILTAELIGKSIAAASLTGALTDRVPAVFEGWEAKLYIDAFGATPGTTNIAGTLINWEVNIKNNLARKYFADNVNAANSLAIGELAIDAKFTIEAAAAQAATEFTNWDAATKRLLSLKFGDNALIGAGPDKEFVRLDLPGAWTAFDLGGSDNGTRAYQLDLSYVFNPTNAFAFQAIVQTARSAAW